MDYALRFEKAILRVLPESRELLRLKPILYYLTLAWRSILMIAEPWLSVDQIAKHLGVKRDSIYRWIDPKGSACTPCWATVEVSSLQG